MCDKVAEHSFVSRRDNTFREYPPASAQLAMIIPFYGELTVWIRKPDSAGWHFPTSGRKDGETILEVAKRELWDSARIVRPSDLLGAIRYQTQGHDGDYKWKAAPPVGYDAPERTGPEIGILHAAGAPRVESVESCSIGAAHDAPAYAKNSAFIPSPVVRTPDALPFAAPRNS